MTATATTSELIHASNDLDPTPTQHTRSWAYVGSKTQGRLVLLRNDNPTAYDVEVHDLGWLLTKDGGDESYLVSCGGDRPVQCTCKGFYHRKKCIHVSVICDWLASETFSEGN